MIDKTEKKMPPLSTEPRNFLAGGRMFIYRGEMPLKDGTVAYRWVTSDGSMEAMSRRRGGRLEMTLTQKFKFPRTEVGVGVADAFFGGVEYTAAVRKEGPLCGFVVFEGKATLPELTRE